MDIVTMDILNWDRVDAGDFDLATAEDYDLSILNLYVLLDTLRAELEF